jgi:hypothetical protein
MKVYWTSVEFDILNPADYENCVGGFVYLFFKAKDVQDAIPKIQESIEEEDPMMKPHGIWKKIKFNMMHWQRKPRQVMKLSGTRYLPMNPKKNNGLNNGLNN